MEVGISCLPPACKKKNCKLVTRKLKPNGSTKKYKTRLVSEVYNIKDVEFLDTYSSVTTITSTRVLMALAAIHNLIMH